MIISAEADLFREEADRARRYAAAMTGQNVIDQLNRIASFYDKLASGQAQPTGIDPPAVTARSSSRQGG